MKEGMNIGRIRGDIKANKKLADSYENHESEWQIYDAPLSSFAPTFKTTLPSKYIEPLDKKIFIDLPGYSEAFRKYIEDILSKSPNTGNITGVEFGGPGSQLFAGFSDKFFKKSVGVCLNDIRTGNDIHRDTAKNHEVLVGDILNPKTDNLLDKVRGKIHSQKTDFIISRMMGPLDEIRLNPALLDRIIRSWYEMLNDGGLLFVQFEYLKEHEPNARFIAAAQAEALIYGQPRSSLQLQIEDWARLIQEKFQSIEIQIGNGVLRILKKPGSPDELPSLKDLVKKTK